MPRLLLVIALLLWGGVTVQAEHELEIPPHCVAAHQALKNAQGQVDPPPVIPETMSREEQRAMIKAWKAKRQPAIDAAQTDLKTCMSQHRQ